MADEQKTDGKPVADKAGTGAEPENKSTSTPGDSGVSIGVQQRIDTLTVQKQKAIDEADALRAKLEKIEQEHMSEQEKAKVAYANEQVEKFKATEHNPLAASAEQMKQVLEAQVNVYRERVPEERRPASFESLPLVQRFDAYRTLAESMDSTSAAKGFDGSGSPAGGEKKGRIWKLSEINQHSGDPAWWKENREEILKAQKEGRVLVTQ